MTPIFRGIIYKIKFRSIGRSVLIMYYVDENNIEFEISDRGTLLHVTNHNDCPADVYIPRRVTAVGLKIRCLSDDLLRGVFNKVVFDNSFHIIMRNTFRFANVNEVVWPSSCEIIPRRCFEGSCLKKISNIENVTNIYDRAFCDSSLEEINWPKACETIPAWCFDNTPLKTITGINDVKYIGDSAFSFCNIEEFVWPSKCPEIPQSCFAHSRLRNLVNIDNIEHISSHAFYNCLCLNSLDLSSLISCKIEEEAFRGVSPERVVLPYYLPEDKIIPMFAEEM